MFGYLLEGPNLPFTVSLAIMLGIALLEGITSLLGFGLSSMVHHVLPDLDLSVDVDGPDLDADVDIHAPGVHADIDVHAPDLDGSHTALSQLLGWLLIGKVPVLVLLVIFLTAFGLIGLALQSVVFGILGFFLPAVAAAPVSFVASLPFVRWTGRGLASLIPGTETSAVSSATFIGRIAVVTLGPARVGHPGRAKLRDQFDRTHYVMVEPDDTEAGESFEAGAEVLLVRSAGVLFKAIRNTSKPLVD